MPNGHASITLMFSLVLSRFVLAPEATHLMPDRFWDFQGNYRR